MRNGILKKLSHDILLSIGNCTKKCFTLYLLKGVRCWKLLNLFILLLLLQVAGNDNYIKIALNHIAALFSVTSSIVDIYAVANKRQAVLNFKVCKIVYQF